MRTLVVLNPAAGGDEDGQAAREALAGLPDAEVRVTESAEEGRTAAARGAATGAGLVVAAGGDGTVHAVLNGLQPHLGEVRFAVVPLGTANDFVRSLSLPGDAAEALEAVRAGTTRRLDVVEVRPGDRPGPILCGNMAAGGFAGNVEEDADEEVKERWGPLSYLRVAAERLGDLEVWRTELQAGGTTVVRDLLTVVVANGRYAGGGIPAAPDADPADGLLDLVWIESMPAADLALVASRVLAGEHRGADGVGTRRVRSVGLRAEPAMPFSLDGERYVFGEVDFRLRRGALRAVVAPDGT